MIIIESFGRGGAPPAARHRPKPRSGPPCHDADHHLIPAPACRRTLVPPLHRGRLDGSEGACDAVDQAKIITSTAAATTRSTLCSSVDGRDPASLSPTQAAAASNPHRRQTDVRIEIEEGDLTRFCRSSASRRILTRPREMFPDLSAGGDRSSTWATGICRLPGRCGPGSLPRCGRPGGRLSRRLGRGAPAPLCPAGTPGRNCARPIAGLSRRGRSDRGRVDIGTRPSAPFSRNFTNSPKLATPLISAVNSVPTDPARRVAR